MSQGLRFLGQFSMSPGIVLVTLAAVSALIWSTCGYVLLKKQGGAAPWHQRPPAYGHRVRATALILLAVNVAVALVLVFGVFRYDIIHAQPVHEGQIGVAVAQFGEGSEMRASARGRELSAFVARSLRREIDLLPGLAGRATIVSTPLVRSVEEALRVAKENRAQLVIWGWVSETTGDVFVPSFTFVDLPEVGAGLRDIPPLYEVEVSGEGSLELSQTVARRTSGLIEYILGLIYLSRGDYDAAIVELRQAIALTEQEAGIKPFAEHEVNKPLNRSLAIYHLALGRTYAAQARPDQAIVEYETALRYDSAYGPIYIGFGNLDYGERRCQEALGWYDKAVRFAPTRASAWYSRGNARFCLGQYDAALADYKQAIQFADQHDKSLSLYHLVVGITLCRLNRFSEGIEELSQAHQLAAPKASVRDAALTEQQSCWATAMVKSVTPSPTRAEARFLTGTLTVTLFPYPTMTPTATRFPTAQATRLRTKTPIPISSTVTPVPAPISTRGYAVAPALLIPANGVSASMDQEFAWRWDGPPLRDDERFDWRLFRSQQGEDVVDVRPVRTTIVKYQLKDLSPANYYWSVRVVQLGSDDRLVRVLSPESERRSLLWSGIATLFCPATATQEPAGTLFPTAPLPTATATKTPFPTTTATSSATPEPVGTLFPTVPPPTDTPFPPATPTGTPFPPATPTDTPFPTGTPEPLLTMTSWCYLEQKPSYK
jgi:tetratricopeptide (TPR) repeat protein